MTSAAVVETVATLRVGRSESARICITRSTSPDSSACTASAVMPPPEEARCRTASSVAWPVSIWCQGPQYGWVFGASCHGATTEPGHDPASVFSVSGDTGGLRPDGYSRRNGPHGAPESDAQRPQPLQRSPFRTREMVGDPAGSISSLPREKAARVPRDSGQADPRPIAWPLPHRSAASRVCRWPKG
jgi:hypothetical protein